METEYSFECPKCCKFFIAQTVGGETTCPYCLALVETPDLNDDQTPSAPAEKPSDR